MPAPTKSARPAARPRSVERRAEEAKRAASQRASNNISRYDSEDMKLTQRRAKGGTVKKMQDGGGLERARSSASARAARLRRELDAVDNRPARQEAEYQAAQQRRREAGGLQRLAMIPEAVRRAQVRLGDRLLRGEQERETAPQRRKLQDAERFLAGEHVPGRKTGGKVTKKACGGKAKKMASGGMCRGMGKATKGGKYSKNG